MWMNETRWGILHALATQASLARGELLKRIRSAGYQRDNITDTDLTELMRDGVITHRLGKYQLTDSRRKAVERFPFRLFEVMYSSE